MSIKLAVRRFFYRLPGKRFGLYRYILFFNLIHKICMLLYFYLFTIIIYRAIPLFMIAGAGLEYLMITWRPFGVNFYEVYKCKEAKIIAAKRLNEE